MNPTAKNDWQRVREIFDDAVGQAPEDRPEFVRKACGDDDQLRAEVESLIDSLDSAENFLETPAVVQVAENTFDDEQRLSRGEMLLHYEIRELIGSGGMGEVYLARDTRLNRNVSIKLLRPSFLPDVHANRRLLREARAAALLEHPNICHIYEISETDKHTFIVMQYVTGTTVADSLASGRIDLARAIDLAIQIVEGLAEAHDRGIIHRDIKPANIMVNDKGQAKILDFGLAKFIEAEAEAETSLRLNSSGSVMGTVPFMSPEQLRGKLVDKRSDLFSFGALLYEMVSGRPAFNRENNAETISAILNDEPDWVVIPTALRPILKKCLSKETDRRYSSAGEVLKDLLDAQATGVFHDANQIFTTPTEQIVTADGDAGRKKHSHTWQSAEEDSGRAFHDLGGDRTAEMLPKSRSIWQSASTRLLAVALAGSGLFFWLQYRGTDPASNFDSMRPVRLVQWRSGASSNDTDYRVSHDGKLVAYSSSRDGGDEGIYVKQTGDGEEIRVTKDSWRNISPIWSPDDQRIAFVSVRENEPGIYVIPSLGGNPTLLFKTEKANLSLRHWSKDGGSIYYEQMGNFYWVDIASRSTHRITDLPDSSAGNDRYFAVSPDEVDIAYCDVQDGRRDIWIAPMTGGKPQRVTDDAGEEHRPIWHPDGKRILYNILRNDFYQINLAYRDSHEQVQVTRGEGNYELIDLSPDGSRIYYTNWEKRSDISGVNTETGEESELAAGMETEMWPEVSPDGSSIVYQSNASTNPTANLQRSVLMVKFPDGHTAPVASNAYNPRWLPDSRQVAFLRWHQEEKKNQLWIVNTVSGEERQVTIDSVLSPSIGLMPISRAEVGEIDFSPDGSRFVYVDFQKPRNVHLGRTDGSASTKLTDSMTSDVRYFSPLFSPKGDKIAYVSVRKPADDPTKREWGVTFLEGGQVKIILLPGSLRMIGWAGSGDAIFVARTARPMTTEPETVEILRMSSSSGSNTIAVLEDIHADSLTLSADGKTLAFTGRRNDKDDIWTISTAGGEPKKLTNNGNTRIFYANLAWSPAGKVIYFDKQEQINTISMFENFR